MKELLILLRGVGVLITLTLALPAFFTQVHAADLRIAYVDVGKVIEDAPQAKQALKKLESEFGPRDKKLVALQNKIKESEDKLQKDALVMKASERRVIERELLSLKRDLRRGKQEFREDYNLRRNEELAVLQKLIFKVINEVAKSEKYDLILHEGTLYASARVDITKKVLRKLEKK